MDALKRTPFYAMHMALNAKIVDFSGWEMPIQYRGIIEEHHHTRKKVSLFDCSHMGQFRISGKNAAEFLHGILPRDVIGQPLGSCRYNFLLNASGGIIDDLIVYRMTADEFFIVVNAGTIDEDATWIKKHAPDDVTFVDESNETAKLDLQGPLAKKMMQHLGFQEEDLPKYFKFIQTEVEGVPMIISQTGYTGERGFEFYFDKKYAEQVWNLLSQLDPDVLPAGLGARDTLRLEVGYPLYGHEMDQTISPIEVGFKRMLTLENHDFIGKAGLENPKTKLAAITLSGRRTARAGAPVLLEDGTVIGKVTSGSFSPTLGISIALAQVTRKTVKRGDSVIIDAGRAKLEGTVVKLPFYKDGTAGK